MSIAYLKFRQRKGESARIIKDFLQKYSEHIESYDIQDIGIVDLSDPSIEVKERSVVRKGGSLLVTIPASFVQYFNLHPSSRLLFVRRKKIGVVYLFPAARVIAYSK